MKIEDLLTDEAVLTELGVRLSQRRIELGLSQAVLANQAGVSKRTVERIEAGATTQTATLLRILRTFQLTDRLLRVALRFRRWFCRFHNSLIPFRS